MKYRSDYRKAKGLGSSKSGVHHWCVQRLTAIALIFLGLWVVFSLGLMESINFENLRLWLQHPLNAVSAALFFVVAAYHGALGVQVVIEDYIHNPFAKYSLLILNKFILYGVAAIDVGLLISLLQKG